MEQAGAPCAEAGVSSSSMRGATQVVQRRMLEFVTEAEQKSAGKACCCLSAESRCSCTQTLAPGTRAAAGFRAKFAGLSARLRPHTRARAHCSSFPLPLFVESPIPSF
eukprot:3455513-Pleurochrysis_carterae.AAC.2